jgi:hypothetical protein
MRKILLAAVVATALFAVGAFAATFSVRSEDVASGTNPVTACATNVDIDFGAASVSSTGVWTVRSATATFDGEGCDGFDAHLAVAPSTTVANARVSGHTASFTFGDTDVASITGASVMVDGQYLPTTATTTP